MLKIRPDTKSIESARRYLDGLSQDVRHEVAFKAALDTAKGGQVDVSQVIRQTLTAPASEVKSRLRVGADEAKELAWIEVLPKAIQLKHFKVSRGTRRTLTAEIVKGRPKARPGLFWDPRKPAGKQGVLYQRIGKNRFPIVKEGHSLTTYLQEGKPIMTGLEAKLGERLIKNVERRLDYALKKNSGVIR